VKKGESRGLNLTFVSNFFKAQIEANKVVQYSLLADWRRSGRAPVHAPIDLVGTIRPELDALQATLIVELRETTAIRASTTCPADVAKAVGKYVLVHKQSFGSLQAMALDRALAATCTLPKLRGNAPSNIQPGAITRKTRTTRRNFNCQTKGFHLAKNRKAVCLQRSCRRRIQSGHQPHVLALRPSMGLTPAKAPMWSAEADIDPVQ
jgi:hypothetical protein